MLVSNMAVTLVYQDQVNWKWVISAWCKDKRGQAFENKVRFVICDTDLPRIDLKIVHKVLLLLEIVWCRALR